MQQLFKWAILSVAFAAGSLLSVQAVIAQNIEGVENGVRVEKGRRLKHIFIIDMENHNFTQPISDTKAPNQIFNNPAAPYQNSLITPGNPNAAHVSYATAYHNVLATPSGNNPSIHPSEPNYIWQEAGSNFGVLNDNDPFKVPGGTNQNTKLHLSALLDQAGISWKSYQEDIDLAKNASGQLTSTVLPQNQWTVPLSSFSGTSPDYTNPYNGSHQYNFAAKHDGHLFFTDSNGGNDPTPANPLASKYAPLQQLEDDLAHNKVASYTLITPDQYNDSHTALSAGFDYNGVHYTGDLAAIAQGDNFLSKIVPTIMSSAAYKDDGAIVIWWDETEGTNQNDFSHTVEEIVISPLAKGNAYNSTLNYTHSSDLKSWEELFDVYAPGGGFLGDANSPNTNDLSDLFKEGALTPKGRKQE
ncbi:MAG: alkaline phosphatase family protein [Aulosira sp. ZfuVER01]|nr:alkaline phosphatase family protein [Aulosira sp. ZfuVER01]MDZ7999745.1 alkaline phosphatase family protein [Aulosira sp. DedVER01a]MDZ8055142.1 alkaline phosphatase family protein [Aulosira sp. ZfuCHP01]